MSSKQINYRIAALQFLMLSSFASIADAQSDWRGDAYLAFKAIANGPYSNTSGMSYAASRTKNGQTNVIETSTSSSYAYSDLIGNGAWRTYANPAAPVDTPFQTFSGSSVASALGSISTRTFGQGPSLGNMPGSILGAVSLLTEYSAGWTDYIAVSGLSAPSTLTIHGATQAPHFGNSLTNTLLDSLYSDIQISQMSGVGTANLKGSSGFAFGGYRYIHQDGSFSGNQPVCPSNCTYTVNGDRIDYTITFNVANGDAFRLTSNLNATAGASYYSNNAWLQTTTWIESIELSSPGTVTSLGGGGVLLKTSLPYGNPVSAVPEPTQAALWMVGIAMLTGVRRRMTRNR